MGKLKDRLVKSNILDIAVAIQVFFIAFQNLFTLEDVLDNDMAKLFVHIAEMWNQRSIFIQDWLYEDLELGFASFFAFFIYGLTRNVYISFGLACIIFLIIFLYVINELLKIAGFGADARKFAMLAFMVPYSFGQLMYTHMLFFGAGYYVIKVLVPLMAFAFLLAGEGYFRQHVPLIVLYYIFLFVTSASTGTYVFLTGLVPLMGGYIFMGCPRSREKTLFIAGSVIDAVVGVGISILAPVDYAVYTAELTTSTDLHDVCVSLVTCFVEMMGCLPDDPIAVSSAMGAACLLRTLFITLFVVFMVVYAVRACRAIYDKPGTTRDVMSVYVITLLICNLFIVIMTGLTSNTRYVLISLCPMMLIYAAELYEKLYTPREKYVRVCMLGIFFLMLALSDYNMAFGEPYPYFRADHVKYDNLEEILDEYPNRNVVLLNDMGTTEILRARNIGDGRIYLTYAAPGATDFGEGFVVTDYYKSLTEPDCIADDYLLVVNEYFGSVDEMPAETRDAFGEVGRYQNFIVYMK